MSLRASVTSELVLDDVRLPGSARAARGRAACAGPLSCLNEARFGIVWGALGAARACLEAALDYAADAGAVRPADRRLPAHPGQARRHDGRAATRAPCWRCTSAARKDAGTLRPAQVSLGKLNNVREALEIARTARTVLGANGITAASTR